MSYVSLLEFPKLGVPIISESREESKRSRKALELKRAQLIKTHAVFILNTVELPGTSPNRKERRQRQRLTRKLAKSLAKKRIE